MRRCLVVANQTLGGENLQAAIRDRVGRGTVEFFIVVPASPPRGSLTWTDGEVALIAQDRLERAIARFRGLGARVGGRVGDTDPFRAVQDVLDTTTFDEIIISTLPHRLSHMLKADLPNRVKNASGRPVTVLTSPAEPTWNEEALRMVPLLATTSKRHLRELARASAVTEYRDGKTILKAGSSGSDLYVILDGSVDVRLADKTVASLAAGEIFGEISLLDPGPRTADVVACGPTRCLHLSGRDFRNALEADPRLAISVLAAVGKRLREIVRAPYG